MLTVLSKEKIILKYLLYKIYLERKVYVNIMEQFFPINF